VTFAAAVAAALQREYSQTKGGIGRVVALTGANERTVRNWFDAKNAPGGDNLVTLCRHSDEVLETILTLSGRMAYVKLGSLERVKQKLIEARTLLLELNLE
jgi:hypothetical protein